MKFIPAVFITAALYLASCEMQEHKHIISTSAAPPPIGPYSQAVEFDNLVYVSGQIALNQQGELDTSSIENECKQVMENLAAVLKAAGSGFDKVIKTTIYTTRLDYFKDINAVYGLYVGKNPPARETVGVARLPKGARIEISMIAHQ